MDTIAKSRLRSVLKRSRSSLVMASVAVLVIGIAGFTILRLQASGFFAAADASQATVSGNAQLVNDSTAYGGKAIQFTAPAMPPPSSPPPSQSGNCPPFPDFPDEKCTGWKHTGVTLATQNCPTTINTNGATYDSCLFKGTVLINASNVTIKRSRIEGRVQALSGSDLRGLQLIDVEIDGMGRHDHNQAALGNSNYNCTRCHVHSTGRGANMTNNAQIEDSYLHGWVTQGDDHETAIGSNGGSGNKVIHNNAICDSGGCSAALSFYGDFAPVNDILVEKNLFNTKGSYCTYAGSVSGKPHPKGTNIRYIDNHFGKLYNPRCGFYGAVDSWASGSGNVWSGNVWADGSGPVNPGS